MLTETDKNWSMSENLCFRDEGPVSKGSKTHKFSVVSRHSRSLLGYVKWFPQWRQYCFFPLNALFDKKCLRELADFCESRTTLQREKAAAKRSGT